MVEWLRLNFTSKTMMQSIFQTPGKGQVQKDESSESSDSEDELNASGQPPAKKAKKLSTPFSSGKGPEESGSSSDDDEEEGPPMKKKAPLKNFKVIQSMSLLVYGSLMQSAVLSCCAYCTPGSNILLFMAHHHAPVHSQ